MLSACIVHAENTDQEELDIAPARKQAATRAAHSDEQQIPTGRIKKITIAGNQSIPAYTILSKIPYRVGDLLKRSKTRLLIKNVYALGVISHVQVAAEPLSSQELELIVTIKEKQPITRVIIEGASALSGSFISKKLELSSITALDEGDFHALASKIKKLYAEKNYHGVTCDGSFRTTENGSTEAIIKITEGNPTSVRRVFFEGNCAFKSTQLKKLLFTREAWVFGFLDRAGSYQPDALEYDRRQIEDFYQDRGYLTAHVEDIRVVPVPGCSDVDVTFVIAEGDPYVVSDVKIVENKILSEAEQCALIPIRPGQWYSKSLIKDSIETLRMLVGEYGYIDAEVMPSIIPNTAAKTVSVGFRTNLGSKMSLNRITLLGNNKTDDKIIRRQLVIDEGELITTRKLELSKNRVQSLGYFDTRNGVNWNIVRLDENTADLELLLQEVKTGQFFAQFGFGGMPTDRSSPSDSFRASVGAQNSNWFGRGVQGNLSASYSQQDRSLDITMADPWLFDRPLYGSIHIFHRRSQYDDFKLATNTPSEMTTAGFAKLGFTVSQLTNTTILGELGFENICFKTLDGKETNFAPLIQRKFQSGNVLSIGGSFIQDLRNHPTHPTNGSLFNTNIKVGIPYSLKSTDFGFTKWELDAQWYAAVIAEYDLVFRLHAFAGIVQSIGNFAIPYRELFHIGGPATVRGFEFGQISPLFEGSSLGAKKAVVVNAELLFPIKLDASIRGVIFYDGGSGWDVPDRHLIPDVGLRNNHFDYRHAVGFGLRLTRPSPVRIDVGFKLDRRKRLGEKLSEVHFSMTQDF